METVLLEEKRQEKNLLKFNVFRWKGYIILATSLEQAQRIWNTWIDSLKISAGDGRLSLFKAIKILENLEERELFPKRIDMVCEFEYPCIIKNIWEFEPVFVYKHLD